MAQHVKKPEWLKIRLGGNEKFTETKSIVERHCLHTICTSGKCPNMGECWSRGTATFMIGGDICTRACRFCNTLTGRPKPLNEAEPTHVALSIKLMGLNHAVVTSVDRDDLPDYGATHWVKTIQEIRRINSGVTLEVLIPDFKGRMDLVDMIIEASPDVISHNLETVRRLTPSVRSVATYDTSLAVLRRIAQSGKMPAKTGMMLGLGETEEEILELMDDALAAGVSVITIGQYLQPSRKNLPVVEYITPEQFEHLRLVGIEKGFRTIESAPLVRSSYHAERHL
ncbi:lipoyl synthase [Porphyromonas gingivalis]|uniref:lipoyl synthase n=1 Tax=Porphyromonas gingivalis TaxID=837 RepID=UPI00265AEECF|nr:lipoyl synthase [Porphyromonas gingivalis]MDP0531815.1 lipoyl synthase [Porphyromonas gingivalis]MDP0624812.1 lipoyl synthase [Porphyromonas gingivalis]WKD52116.1 lipoyl synthase [Porphyromonas gingivalis]WKD54167.1 lipoyl synthase [Porphyromonas gingivalis]